MNDTDKIIQYSPTPKYRQLENLIISDIESGILKLDEKLPSINETSEEYLVSRDTVEKAYTSLKNRGIIKSVSGKGYFVAKTNLSTRIRVCLLMNKLSDYKRQIYYSLLKTLDNKADVDLYIYNYNVKLFEKYIINNLSNYDYFVILPYFIAGSKSYSDIIKKIPEKKVVIIDRKENKPAKGSSNIYQDFLSDIFDALETGLVNLKKYKHLILVDSDDDMIHKEILKGFNFFCKQNNFKSSVIKQIDNSDLKKGEVYIIVNDIDLVKFIKKLRKIDLCLGKEIGLISYNESPVKEILAKGITTISANHEKIGELAGKVILEGKKQIKRVPFEFILRNTL
ncbi:GntR family transcriptional regulator [Bacteroidota bacterium]